MSSPSDLPVQLVHTPTEAESVATISQTGIHAVASSQRYVADRWTNCLTFIALLAAGVAIIAIFHG